MTPTGWHYPEADSGGFTAFARLRRRTREMTREQFLEEFPLPAVLVIHHHDVTPDESVNLANQGMQLLTSVTESATILRYLNRIAFLCKKPGNLYAHLISVGRSTTNDISIAVDSVSKVHGYFSRDGDSWCFTDHGSTNGSLLDNQPLEAGSKVALTDKAQLQLGLEVVLEFFTPGRLYDWLGQGR